MSILLREQEQVIAVKLETVYGTDSTPAGANAILAHDITVRELEGDVAERKNFKGFLGNSGSIRLNSYCSVEFAVELCGVGAANLGDAPYYNSLYLASGHAEALTVDTKADYTPVSEDLDSVSIYYQVGEHRHAILGVRGSLMFEGGTKQLPRLKFRGLGLYVAPVKTALAGVDFSAIRKPIPFVQSTIEALTLDAVTLNLSTWSFDQGHAPEFLALTGQEEVICPGRSSTLNLKFREDDVTTKNWFEENRANASAAFVLQHGTDASHDGDIFEFNSPNVEIGVPTRSFEQQIAYLTVPCPIVPLTKNSDYSFTHR